MNLEFPGNTPFHESLMSRTATFVCIIALLLLITPAAATLVLTDAVFAPNPPFLNGARQHAIVKFFISPSGATTFVPGHQLQMETGLANAQWNIQVRVDGRNDARQSASGSAAFVNGALLSYSTDNDVSLEVTIDGVVPHIQRDQVIVLQVKEIDNTGDVVPGSVITLSQPVAGEPATPQQIAFPTPKPTPVPHLPTKSAAFPGDHGDSRNQPGLDPVEERQVGTPTGTGVDPAGCFKPFWRRFPRQGKTGKENLFLCFLEKRT